MNLLVVVGIVAVAVAVGVGLMYGVRQAASNHSFLTDTTRGAAIFGVVGTAFAVLLAFVMFVAFGSYNNARDAAGREATAAIDMFRTAKYFPPAERDAVQGSLTCYARAAVEQDWPAMKDGHSSEVVDGWRLHLEDAIRALEPQTFQQEAAFQQLLNERDARTAARQDRLTEAEPVISAPVWLILGLGGLATVSFVVLFTDRREAFAVQASLMATVAAMVAASMTLVWFLDHPFQDATGSVQPEEMERTLDDMASEHPGFAPPCDERGDPVSAPAERVRL